MHHLFKRFVFILCVLCVCVCMFMSVCLLAHMYPLSCAWYSLRPEEEVRFLEAAEDSELSNMGTGNSSSPLQEQMLWTIELSLQPSEHHLYLTCSATFITTALTVCHFFVILASKNLVYPFGIYRFSTIKARWCCYTSKLFVKRN